MSRDPELQRIRTSIEVLETMNNLGVLYDPRFGKAKDTLRAVALGTSTDYDSYDKLKQISHYSIMQDPGFWLQGESIQELTRRGDTRSQSYQETVAAHTTRVRLGPASTWDAKITQIKKVDRLIERSGPDSVVSGYARQSIGAGETQKAALKSEAIHSLAERSALKSDRQKMVRRLIRDQSSQMTADLSVLKRDESVVPDRALFEKNIRKIAGFFANDKTLSSKTRNAFQHFSGSHDTGHYSLNPDLLATNPNLRWMLNLNSDSSRAELMAAVKMQTKEFYLLAKMMAYTIAKSNLTASEEEFLLQPSSASPDSEAVISLYSQLCTSFAPLEPEYQREAIRRIAPNLQKGIKDLITPDQQKHLRNKFRDWYYSNGLPHSFTRDRDAYVMAASTGALTGAIIAVELYVLAGHNQADHGASQRDVAEAVALPDQISISQLEGLKPSAVAEIIHLPEGIAEGDDIGFMPVKLNGARSEYLNPIQQRLAEVNYYEGGAEVIAKENEVALKFSDVPEALYPPVGYRIRAVYQQSGEAPMVSASGEITWWRFEEGGRWSLLERPQDIVIIAEPIPEEESPYEGITFYEGVRASEYHLYDFNPDSAKKYIDSLGEGDEGLKNIYMRAMDEINRADKFDVGTLSDIMGRYSSEYLRYIKESGRYYGLTMEVGQSVDTEYTAFERIVENPGSGFFCSIASQGLRDFWGAMGLYAPTQEGYHIRNFDGEAWKHLGHANNRILFPDGRIGFVDTTPPVVEGKTPQRDLEALRPKSPDESEKTFIEIAQEAADKGVPIAASAALLAGLAKGLGAVNEKRMQRRYSRLLKGYEEKAFTPAESQFASSLLYSINAAPLENVEAYAQHTAGLLALAARVDVKRHSELIGWISDNSYGIWGEAFKDMSNFDVHNEKAVRDTLNDLVEAFYANEGGIRDKLPEEFHGYIRAVAKGQEATEEDFPPDFIDAVKVGMLNSYTRLSATVEYLETFRAPERSSMSQREAEERLKLNRILAFKVSSKAGHNVRYLSIVSQASKRMI